MRTSYSPASISPKSNEPSVSVMLEILRLSIYYTTAFPIGLVPSVTVPFSTPFVTAVSSTSVT